MKPSEEKEILDALKGSLAVADGDLKLAISGPHTDLRTAGQFYEVHLSVDGHEARTRVNAGELPVGFSYVMESGLGYAEDLICEALSRKYWEPSEPAKLLIDRLVQERAERLVPRGHKLATDKEVTMNIMVGGGTFGQIRYSPSETEGRRFSFYRWSKGVYRELGCRATLEQATEALLGAR